MRMMNEMMSDALDSQKFVDALKAQERQVQKVPQAEGYGNETRTQRRARERSEAKAARKAKA